MSNKEKAIEVIELVDVYGWSLSKAKSEFKKLTGITVTAKSKDDLVKKLYQIK